MIDAILAKVKGGRRVIYVPGNHDEAFRDYCGVLLPESSCCPKRSTGLPTERAPGDSWRQFRRHCHLCPLVGTPRRSGLCLTLKLNDVVNVARRWLGLPHWSLSAFLKHKVKNAASFIADFEQAVARAARSRGADGVVCGHIHNAQVKTIDGVLYCNDGDWVESCTALVEDARGRLEIVQWTSFAYERKVAQQEARKALIQGPLEPVAA